MRIATFLKRWYTIHDAVAAPHGPPEAFECWFCGARFAAPSEPPTPPGRECPGCGLNTGYPE